LTIGGRELVLPIELRSTLDSTVTNSGVIEVADAHPPAFHRATRDCLVRRLEGTQNHSALCPVGARVTGVEKPDLCNRIIIGFLTEPADEAAGSR
jgi:hypothetical protein